MKKKRTIIPNDFRDFLSLISFVGFLGIFLSFTFDVQFISENSTAFFLLFGGLGFLVIGKAFQFKRWLKDGIQQNEISQVFSIVLGLSAIIIGILLFAQISLPEQFLGIVGIIALVPAIYTLIDYLAKNTALHKN